jgi:hypothetical protein
VQLLEEISHVADTFWVTRREVRWDAAEFDTAARVAAIAGVEERVRRGEPPGSVISVTGQHRTPWARAADERGVLVRHPMFARIEEHGVRMPDGTFEPADVILWATGFRADIAHLARSGCGPRWRHPRGERSRDRRAAPVPHRLRPSQSTVGANRAGRDAARHRIAEPAAHRAPRPVAGGSRTVASRRA